VIAPHPFYQERGTPIDVLLVLRVLAERDDTKVDLLTYHEGRDIDLPNLRIFRNRKLPGLNNIRPGFSLKKVITDFLLFLRAIQLVHKNRYDFIHAGEEAVFFAMIFKRIYGIPFAYDLDSSIAQQLVEKKPWLRVFSAFFNWMESLAIRDGIITFPVCNALADLCRENGAEKTVTLHDISQLKEPEKADPDRVWREIGDHGTVFLYSGNLESYQGVDLLLESFSVALEKEPELALVIVGGTWDDIEHYRDKSAQLGISQKTFFLGPRPFEDLGDYLSGADVLVCPRIRGVNTPMKIFPYLHSGIPVLATDLPTHNQLLTQEEACLAGANPRDFGKAMLTLKNNPSLRRRLGKNGQAFVEENHTFKAHRKRLNTAYDWIEKNLGERQILNAS